MRRTSLETETARKRILSSEGAAESSQTRWIGLKTGTWSSATRIAIGEVVDFSFDPIRQKMIDADFWTWASASATPQPALISAPDLLSVLDGKKTLHGGTLGERPQRSPPV